MESMQQWYERRNHPPGEATNRRNKNKRRIEPKAFPQGRVLISIYYRRKEKKYDDTRKPKENEPKRIFTDCY